jgi:hypothetical protein
LGIAATLTRLLGLIVVPLLVFEWWQQRRTRPAGARPGETALFAALLAPLGTVAYMLYLKIAFGDPLAFAHAAAQWGREPQSPLETLLEMLRAPAERLAAGVVRWAPALDNWIDLLSARRSSRWVWRSRGSDVGARRLRAARGIAAPLRLADEPASLRGVLFPSSAGAGAPALV